MALNVNELVAKAAAAIAVIASKRTIKPAAAAFGGAGGDGDIAGYLPDGEYIFDEAYEDKAKISGQERTFDVACFINEAGKPVLVSLSALCRRKVWVNNDWFRSSCPVLTKGQVVKVVTTEGLVARFGSDGKPMPATAMVSASGEALLTVVDNSGQRMLAKKAFAMTVTVVA